MTPELRSLAIECARRSMFSSGDMWPLEVFDGDPSSVRDLTRFWRYRVADPRFYSFVPEDMVLVGSGQDGPGEISVYVDGVLEREPRPGRAFRSWARDPVYAGSFPVTELVESSQGSLL